MLNNLGERIRQARKKKGYRQADLAEKLGISTSSVGQFEINKNKPSLENLLRISEICEVDLYWLLKGEERKGSSEFQSKSFDNGAFGSEVERVIQENRELKKEKQDLLEIIKNLSMGKDEVIENPASVSTTLKSVTVSMTQQLDELDKAA